MSRTRCLFAAAMLLAFGPTLVRAQTPVPEPHIVTDVVVRPGDLLRLKFWPEQQYSGDYQVETSGIVAIPLLGEIHVVGEPLSVVRDTVRNRYRALTTNGVAIASLVFRVSVLGQVLRPGLYSVDATQSVFDALSQAGGPTDRADLEHVRLLRDNHVVLLDAATALETGSPMLSILLASGDRVVVPAKSVNWLTWQNTLTVLQSIGLVVALTQHR